MAGGRRPKSDQALARRAGSRKPRDRVLIVCEGEKTEPRYFEGLKQDWRLPTADVVICGRECRSDPLKIVDFAVRKDKQDGPFDAVYCVFDREWTDARFKTFDKALAAITKKGSRFRAVPSDPCFEYWILCHYEKTTSVFVDQDDIRRRVCQYLPHYEKGMIGLWLVLRDNLGKAIEAACWGREQIKQTQAQGPYTEVDKIIDALRTLRAG
ncbi:RloB family protein [Pararhodospirillum oryzae]|uniref:RloB domain-containing protein n=1 Tax=Pararhodospirillum oryzae TaxID=478448 RepID=A0A512H3Z4_9PROT|nr:RloB family protein [Pararhodospirillum oryzae]GEO80189.1 hypothetical protein ROR02_03200 [Pararhodospirillum oryzae]